MGDASLLQPERNVPVTQISCILHDVAVKEKPINSSSRRNIAKTKYINQSKSQ